MIFKLNKDKLKDKVLACWIGKNIGGTVRGSEKLPRSSSKH